MPENSPYPIALEIESSFAMFANPTSGGSAVSFPAPPYSSAKGMFESILFIPAAQVVPYKVHICRPTKFVPFSYNSRSPLRKPDLIKDGNALQRRDVMLFDVVFQIFANVVMVGDRVLSPTAKQFKGVNHAHAYQEIFCRRIASGRSQKNVYVGRSECVPTYWGPIRDENKPDPSVNTVLPQMLHHPFSIDQCPPGSQSQFSARFRQLVEIKGGVLFYESA